MMLAGLRVRDADVLELARRLRAAGFDAVAERLEAAYDLETKVLALTIGEREGARIGRGGLRVACGGAICQSPASAAGVHACYPVILPLPVGARRSPSLRFA